MSLFVNCATSGIRVKWGVADEWETVKAAVEIADAVARRLEEINKAQEYRSTGGFGDFIPGSSTVPQKTRRLHGRGTSPATRRILRGREIAYQRISGRQIVRGAGR